MTCPICHRGSDVEHGRVLCQWRRHPSAWGVRAALEIERHARSPEPGADRLRLAWWVVQRACVLGHPADEYAKIARSLAKRASHEIDWDALDPIGARADRDVSRYAANRWALAALEAIL